MINNALLLGVVGLILGAEFAQSAPSGSFIVDRFGQSVRKNYPDKITSEEELKADVEKQKRELPKAGPTALDKFGGLSGSGEKYKLKKTGFFHVEKAGERLVLVTPEGNVFFHLGPCGVNANIDDYTLVDGRETTYEWIPEKKGEFARVWRPEGPAGVMSFYIANWIRKFGKSYDPEEFGRQTVERLRAWGFNSAGAFSRYSPGVMQGLNFPYVAHLPSGKIPGIQLFPDKIGASKLLDPFAPGNEKALDDAFAKALAPGASDPLLIGYFLGNEQHFENIPKLIPTYKSTCASKLRLVELLQKKYGEIQKFNEAWNPAKPFASFDELKDQPLFIRTEAGAQDMKEFFELFMETYYSLIHRVYRKHDSNHLLIGSRWTAGTAGSEIVVRAGGKYLDVLSINYYTYAIEESFLKKVHERSGGKPIILSEWHFCADDQGLLARKEVRNQNERGLAYRNYLESSAALPYVVGSEWFSYMDQSITGRFFEGFNGEGNNIGLINVVDRPYEELVSQAKLSNDQIYAIMMGEKAPFHFDDPRFTAKEMGTSRKVLSIAQSLPGIKLDGTTANWPGRPADSIDGTRIVEGKPSDDFRADFRLCWDVTNLYLHILVKDPIPMKNQQKGKKLWLGDGIEIFVGDQKPDEGGPMLFTDRHISISASGEKPEIFVAGNEAGAGDCSALVVREVSGDGYTLVATIPWKVMGITPADGKELLFDVAVNNSDDGERRKQALVWNGTGKNSVDRGKWGRAKLATN